MSARFNLDTFVQDLLDARTQPAVREVVERAVSDPAAVVNEIGAPSRGQLQTLYRSEQLTVLNVIWTPKMTLFPHDHTIWAVIGIYAGREDNIFWRRLPEANGKVEAAGAKSICERDAVSLGADIVHSVTNPIERFTGAIHVYGGDFFNANRSEWDPETLCQKPLDVEHLVRIYDEENTRWNLMQTAKTNAPNYQQ